MVHTRPGLQGRQKAANAPYQMDNQCFPALPTPLARGLLHRGM